MRIIINPSLCLHTPGLSRGLTEGSFLKKRTQNLGIRRSVRCVAGSGFDHLDIR